MLSDAQSVPDQKGIPYTLNNTFRTRLVLPMLSVPAASNFQRRPEHRRQSSTPTVFEASKIPVHPADIHRYDAHRRGMSVDQINLLYRPNTPQGSTQVITNLGQEQFQQHSLQVAQQHRQAQPGQARDTYQEQHTQSLPIRSEQEFREQQHRVLDAQLDALCRPSAQAQVWTPTDGNSFGASAHQQFGGSQNGLQSIPQGVPLCPSPNPPASTFGHGFTQDRKFEPTSPMSCVGHERRMSLQPYWNLEAQRPITPPYQSISNCFPITPETTPHGISRYSGSMASQSQGSSPPLHGSPHWERASSDMVYIPGRHFKQENIPSPPHTAPLSSSATFDLAPLPVTASLGDVPVIHLEPSTGDRSYESSNYSPHSVAASSTRSSLPSSPELGYMALLDNSSAGVPKLESLVGRALFPANERYMDYGLYSPFKVPASPRSFSFMEDGLDASIANTGVSMEQVQVYISEQNPIDQKWTCQYPDCNKKFGRRENIKSHVQTHLGDRQFVCNVCKKDFVRQHDLKRHFKIHKGNKDYMCRCGSGFARHDALTRHRQRGFCEGAFEGIVKKPVKRGRPRKERPDLEERLEKAARTKQRVLEKAYESSTSSSSESSTVGSPRQFQEDMPVSAGSLDDFPDSAAEMSALDTTTLSFHPNAFSYTPPISPSYSTGTLTSTEEFQAHLRAVAADSPCPSPVEQLLSSVLEEAQFIDFQEENHAENSSCANDVPIEGESFAESSYSMTTVHLPEGTVEENSSSNTYVAVPEGLLEENSCGNSYAAMPEENFEETSSGMDYIPMPGLIHSSPINPQFVELPASIASEQRRDQQDHDHIFLDNSEDIGDFCPSDKAENMFSSEFEDSFFSGHGLGFSSKMDFDPDDLFSDPFHSGQTLFETPTP